MKKKQLKVRFGLFLSLVIMLSLLGGLYLGFCRGKGYNSVKIDITIPTEVETTTETAPIEETTLAEGETTEIVTEEPTTEAPKTSWKNYNPAEQLVGENWALTLINKKYLLDKSYIPETDSLTEDSSISADVRVADAFKAMFNDAQSVDVKLVPIGGYCSFQKQKTYFDSKVKAFTLQGMTQEEAVEAASKRIEPAGASENEAGLSVDIVSASAGFANTNEFKWLNDNAHKYGFILRYPSDKSEITGIVFQPWHWRYVGIDAATEMKTNNLCLEEYLKAE